MKPFLLVIFLLILTTEIKSQHIILNELSTVDLPLNQSIEINSFSTVYHSYLKKVTSPEFINPRMESIPPTKTICNCKDNLIIECISKTKNKLDVTTSYTYNNENNIAKINTINEFNTTFKFVYDALNRPVKIFKQTGEDIWLHESASYEDAVVKISTYDLNGEVSEYQRQPGKLVITKSADPYLAATDKSKK